MTSEHEKWQKLKNNYLRQVEEALASVGHPKTIEVLRDVDENLETKYAELQPTSKSGKLSSKLLSIRKVLKYWMPKPPLVRH